MGVTIIAYKPILYSNKKRGNGTKSPVQDPVIAIDTENKKNYN